MLNSRKEDLDNFNKVQSGIFSDPRVHGETDLVHLEMDTQIVTSKRQPARRMLFTVIQEVSRQLKEMQEGAYSN